LLDNEAKRLTGHWQLAISGMLANSGLILSNPPAAYLPVN
jgi:hypothetical protein